MIRNIIIIFLLMVTFKCDASTNGYNEDRVICGSPLLGCIANELYIMRKQQLAVEICKAKYPNSYLITCLEKISTNEDK